MRPMKAVVLGVLLGAAALPLAAGPLQQTVESYGATTTGDGTFVTYCSSCHGKTGGGDGPLADSLRVRPADLTQLARRNKGTFDADKVRKAIDGRDINRGHGSSDMPVWGDAFKNATEGYSEKAVRARIDLLVEYLRSIQAKDKPAAAK